MTQAAPTSSSATKTALLDAAERLFAEAGIAETSLRAITGEADVNLASVNYHFGSKEGLVRAVFSRRLGPLNRRRLEILARHTRVSAGGFRLEDLLRAFIEPAVRMMSSEDPGDRQFIKLLSRTLFEPTAERRSLILEEFREVSDAFTEALQRLFPATPRQEIVWALHFMVGSLAHTVACRFMVSHRLAQADLPDDGTDDTLTDRLVAFLAGGWQRFERAGDPRR